MNRKALYVALASLLAIVVVFVIALYRIGQQIAAPPNPPLRYTQTEYQAERAVYAPGETVVYTAALTIERFGGVKVIRGFRTRPKNGRPVMCDGTLASIANGGVIEDTPPPFPPAAVGQEIEGRIPVKVPNLPAGEYWLVSTVFKLDGGEAVTQVPVTIRKPC